MPVAGVRQRQRVPLPLQESVHALESAAHDFKPLVLREMQAKPHWDPPSVKVFSPELVAAEIQAASEERARAAQSGQAPRPLSAKDSAVVGVYMQRRNKMDALGALNSRANLARASALLRAEAWRRKQEISDSKTHHLKKKASHKVDDSDCGLRRRSNARRRPTRKALGPDARSGCPA